MRGQMAGSRVLNIGIDFGTSRSVISCDNGIRTFIPSYVGFPKDAVSRKLFGKDIVFGDEVVKNRLSLDLYRPLDRGVLKYSDDRDINRKDYKQAINVARKLFEHLVLLATEGNPKGHVIRGVIGTPALASKKNKQALLEISEGILDAVLIASEPFTVAYGLNLLTNSLIVDIGAGTVDLCRMRGVMPSEDDQITTFKAGDHIDQVFFDLIKAKYPEANSTVNMVKKFKEENALISRNGERLYITLPVKGKPTQLDVTEELREACRSIVPEIVDAVKHLVTTFDPEFQDSLKENVVLAGGGSQIIGLREAIETYMRETLGYGKVRKIDEPVFAGANGALMLCKDMPEKYWVDLKTAA